MNPPIPVRQNLPVMALAVGWIGLLRGMELDLDRLRKAPRGATRLMVGDDLVAGLAVGIP